MSGFNVRHFFRDCRGAILAWVAIWLPVLLGGGALAIDMAYGYWTRDELQVAASAAALASVVKLVDEDEDDVADTRDFQAQALDYAFKNMPFARFGTVVNPACGVDPVTGAIDPTLTGLSEFDAAYPGLECTDVKAGFWDQAAIPPIFIPWDDPGYDDTLMELIAVRVITKRSDANDNPLNFFLAGVIGIPQADVQTSAVAKLAIGITATGGPDSCLFATSPDEEGALYVFGNAGLTLIQCDVQVNSTDDCAFKLQGNPTMNMGDIYGDSYLHVVGDGDGSGYCEVGGSVDIYPGEEVIETGDQPVEIPYDGRDPTENCSTQGFVDDPYCNLQVSSELPCAGPGNLNGANHCDFGAGNMYDGVALTDLPDCGAVNNRTCTTVVAGETRVRAFPGTYTADTTKYSMQFTGLDGVEFYPGEYVVYHGELRVGGNTSVSINEGTLSTAETGVAYYLTGNAATLNLTGGGELTLSAPTDPNSPLLGYLFFEDQDEADQPAGTTHLLRGGTNSLYEGTAFFKNDVEFKGTTGTAGVGGGECFSVFANTLYFNGTNDFQLGNNCNNDVQIPLPVRNTTIVLSLVE